MTQPDPAHSSAHSPSATSASRYVLFAPSLSGKTTAHKQGVVLDPEETPDYRVWKEGWSDPAKVNDPRWRVAQRAAYRDAVRVALASDAPVVVTHPTDPHKLPLHGRIPVFYLPTSAARRRIDAALRADMGKAYFHARADAYHRGRTLAAQLSETHPSVTADHVAAAALHLIQSSSTSRSGGHDAVLHRA